VTRTACFALGTLTLAVLWIGPLPELAPQYFSAHMAMHMGVVAVAAPLLALGVAGTGLDPTHRFPAALSPIPASVLELVVVWAWHAPALHHIARMTGGGLIAEQSTFLLAALLVWVSSFGSRPAHGADRAGAGVVALLLTSMHMTLLGALLALAPRPLYAHATAMRGAAAALDDQHLGGAIMLMVGGAAYLAGGLWLASTLLTGRPAPQPREPLG
jgi:putative membrane protein